MISQPKITEQITAEIIERASAGDEPTTAIFDTLVLADIDWRSITSDEVKPVLVKAIRAFRTARVNASKPSHSFSNSVAMNAQSPA